MIFLIRQIRQNSTWLCADYDVSRNVIRSDDIVNDDVNDDDVDADDNIIIWATLDNKIGVDNIIPNWSTIEQDDDMTNISDDSLLGGNWSV